MPLVPTAEIMDQTVRRYRNVQIQAGDHIIIIIIITAADSLPGVLRHAIEATSSSR